MKVNVTKAGHYIKVDGVTTELEKGEQEIADSVAEKMVKSGFAEAVKVEVKLEDIKEEEEVKAEVKPTPKKTASTKK
ncbi:MAG: hypothetical protein Unbinned6437contig1000_82 [Prokaryotic dsDNA virus sp.]|nr:MAG: hypothetical protein Unbinned6437contig1000_82 [Prokaryotic dsDNA virus sp.]